MKNNRGPSKHHPQWSDGWKDGWKVFAPTAAIRALMLMLLALLNAPAWAQQQWDFREFATQSGNTIFDLHTLTMIIILVIFAGVCGVILYSVVMHRKSRGVKPAHFHENIWVEIIWTTIPMIILVLLAIPATKAIVEIRNNNDADLVVKVTGYQFKWGYEYFDGPAKGVKLFSSLKTPNEQIYEAAAKDANYLLDVTEELVLPVGKRIKLLITSNDVLHGFWIQQLAVQQTAVPGFIREFTFTPDKIGTFRGQCSELCGANHAFMPIVINVVSNEDYEKWASEKVASAGSVDVNREYDMKELMEIGDKYYHTTCVACHQANGEGIKGAFPALAGSPLVNGDPVEVLKVVANGRPGTAMAAFGKQVDDVQIAGVVTYIRNSFGNAKGDSVQPKDVAAIKTP